MSRPIRCSGCGKVIGAYSGLGFHTPRPNLCHGKGCNDDFLRTETIHAFGLLKRVYRPHLFGNASVWEEYIGPRKYLTARFASLFSEKGTKGSLFGDIFDPISKKWMFGDIPETFKEALNINE